MAKKNKEITLNDPTEGTIHRMKRVLRNERTQFIIGVGFLLFSLYLLIALLSFFYTGATDQSKIENLSIGELSSVQNQITNWAGSLGAYLSNLLFNKWMGVSAFSLCILSVFIGLKLMKFKSISVIRAMLYTCVFMAWCSLFFGFFFVNSYNDTFMYLGGFHGYYTSLWLSANIGWMGTLLVIIGLFVTILIIVSRQTVPFLRKLFTKKEEQKDIFAQDEELSQNIAQLKAENKDVFASVYTDDANELIDDASFEPMGHKKGIDLTNETDLYIDDMKEEEEDIPLDKKYPAQNTFGMNKNEKIETGDPEFTVTRNIEETAEHNIENMGDYDPTADLSHYRAPSFDLLNKYENTDVQVDMEEQSANKKRITETLENYGIRISSIKATVGPTITLYEIIPEPGVRIAKIRSLEDDIALSLAALGIRIIAPIPGKGTIGIEVPNKEAQIVSMYSVIASKKFQECKYDLPIALGKTITNEIFMADLCKMPHVLVAGATGQGKSVGLNAIITSLLYKKHPSQLKLVLIDPKKVEFNIYANIEKHFLAKLPDTDDAIITDVTKVVQTLNSITREMDDRYDLLKKASARNIKEYNAKFLSRRLNPGNGHRFMPYIVVIVDEYGDLIMTAGKEVELPIARIAQLARAVGIHMVIATQRPSANIITGIIKANFPSRIAFRVSSMVDSRTILDCPGANQLIGRGDMLFSQGSDLIRVQCAFIDTPEVETVSEYISKQQGYPSAYLLPEYSVEGDGGGSDVDLRDRDSMFEDAARLVVANQQGSTSLIQRKFSIGYNRAGRIMDQLEAAGIVGPFEGSKARQVNIMDEMQLEQLLANMK